ncbi:uncharacterized protein [Physcomitrium patens]|uniref:Uncharacterized protein n=1 Tax=Physcomitrium patens TaxID=3218 RepID=A0A2K1IWV8_PHYPA|nr:hypothetical protein PHYPA_023571 [Physcomitrium patens]
MTHSAAKKANSLDREQDPVDIEAIRERLSRRFGKDLHHLSTRKAPVRTRKDSKADLRTIKQKLCDRFKHIRLPTLCGVRYRQTTSFRERDIPEGATSTYAIVLNNQKIHPNTSADSIELPSITNIRCCLL